MRPKVRAVGWLFGACLLWATAVGPSRLLGQRPEVERQVPVDSLRRVLEIGPDLRAEAGLPALAGFVVARLLVREDGTYVLEVTLRENGALVRRRELLTPAALDALRERVRAAVDEGRVRTVDQAGRGGLILGETVLGALFRGWATAAALDLDGDRAVVGTYLLVSGGSFLIPYQLTRNATVTNAHRDYTFWGGSRGGVLGWFAGDLITGDDTNSDDRDRARLGGAVVGSVLGSLLSYATVSRAGAPSGDVALWSALGDFGIGIGGATAEAAGLYDQQFVAGTIDSRRPRSRRGAAATVLGMGAAGMLAGHWLDGREAYTVGDATALRATGLLGAQLLIPLADAIHDDGSSDEGILWGALAVGAGVGLVAGNRLLRAESFSTGDGLLILAGQLGGGLGALGLAYVLSGDSGGDHSTLFLASAAAGSAAGLALTWKALSSRSGGSGENGGAADRLSVRIDPSALLAPRLQDGRVAAPWLTLRW